MVQEHWTKLILVSTDTLDWYLLQSATLDMKKAAQRTKAILAWSFPSFAGCEESAFRATTEEV